MRLFIALEINPPAREALAALPGRLSAPLPVRWVPAARLHITLLFIGEVTESGLSPLLEGLKSAAASARPFDYAFDAPGLFSRRDGAVLWIGAAPPPPLEALASAVRAALPGFPADKPFRAHVTVGRSRARIRRETFTDLAFDPIPARAERILLVQSLLGPAGPDYATVGEFRLGGG